MMTKEPLTILWNLGICLEWCKDEGLRIET